MRIILVTLVILIIMLLLILVINKHQTIIVWKRTGGINLLSTRRNNVKVDREKLREYVEENPDSYLVEIAAALGVKKSSIWYNLKAMGYSRKKRLQGLPTRPGKDIAV